MRVLPQVLVLEEHAVESCDFGAMLTQWGYQLEYADDLQDVQLKLQHDHIPVVLATWGWRGMPSDELCWRIRQFHVQRYSYIILVLKEADEAELINALASGADEVLRWPIDDSELEARLQSAFRRVELHAQLHAQTDILARAHEVIAQDLRTVSMLQRSYLPPPCSPYSDLHYQWLSLPSMHISGDHLSVFRLHPQYYIFYLLDVAGHGVSAAVKSMQLVQLLSDHSSSSILFEPALTEEGRHVPSRPSVVVSRLNALFQQTESESSYFTMIYGVMNTKDRSVSFCQAGHPAPLLMRDGQPAQFVGHGGYPVGLFEGVEYEDIELTLGHRDSMVLYSDGLTEVWSDQQEAFGDDRLLASVNQFVNQPSAEQGLLVQLAHTVEAWGGRVLQRQGFQDDVSMLALSFGETAVTRAGRAEYVASAVGPVFRPQETQGLLLQDLHHTHRSILIVDDSRSFLRIFEAMLKNWGYQVFTAQSGQEALSVIEREPLDFVLSDWDMPSMSGIELCQHVRSQQRHAYIYIIMVTGYASREDLLHSLRVGADDFLTKPVNPVELKVRLGTACRIARLHLSLMQHHEQLQHLYDVLQRDIREVSRIQKALLPPAHVEPWPCAFQGLNHRTEHVSGMQWGLLDTRPNEFGFFMVSMPSHDLSMALQAMTFSRCLSTRQATQVLLHSEGHSSKQQRLLENPAEACQQAVRLSSAFIDPEMPVGVLYGVLNVNQGVLLLAGVGHWRIFIEQAQQGGELKEIHHEAGGMMYEGPLSPGSRLFCAPLESTQLLGLNTLEDWQRQLGSFGHDEAEHQGQSLASIFEHLERRIRNRPHLREKNLMCVGVQWREHFEYQVAEVQPAQLAEWHRQCSMIVDEQSDSLSHFEGAVKLGSFCACIAYSMVCDTQNIAAISIEVRQFLEAQHYAEELCYNVDLALSECLTNIMVHAFRGVHPKPVHLVVLAYHHAVGVMVQDQGRRIPQSEFNRVVSQQEFEQDLALEVLPEGGMGLLFMRMLSKRFVYQSEGEKNTLWLLF